jgi:UDPglucose 6-dehydrogenase
MEKIGIIGQGFVGTAVKEKFREKCIVYTYDKFEPSKSAIYKKSEDFVSPKNDISTLVKECDIIFICVPTPMFEDGECDISIVESVILELSSNCNSLDREVVAVLKSTVPPGTTSNLNAISDRVNVVFSPEFLTEANSINDFKNQTRIVIGTDDYENINGVGSIFRDVFPTADILIISTKEAEMVKYTTNLFLATKVSFFNDIYSICERLEINYDAVIQATMYDSRIGKSHYKVPGPDGDRGFGGHCFPKDISAIIYVAEKLGMSVPTIMGAYVTNQIVRENRDWEQMEGRAVSHREKEIDQINFQEVEADEKESNN